MRFVLMVMLVACVDPTEPQPTNDGGADARPPDGYLGTLLGSACDLPAYPIVRRCEGELGACMDEHGVGEGIGVCRPWCYWPGTNKLRCEALGGVEHIERGACVCSPK